MHSGEVVVCERIALAGGGFAIVCTGRHRRPRPSCVKCGERSERLCDHRNSDGRSCDAPLCARCAVRVGARDYCPVHAKGIAAAALPFEATR